MSAVGNSVVGMALVGLAAGLIGGVVLSEVIGVAGYLAFDRFVGIRFLPLLLGAAGAALAPLLYRRRGR